MVFRLGLGVFFLFSDVPLCSNAKISMVLVKNSKSIHQDSCIKIWPAKISPKQYIFLLIGINLFTYRKREIKNIFRILKELIMKLFRVSSKK